MAECKRLGGEVGVRLGARGYDDRIMRVCVLLRGVTC